MTDGYLQSDLLVLRDTLAALEAHQTYSQQKPRHFLLGSVGSRLRLLLAKAMNGKKERERQFLVDPEDPEYIKDLQRPAVIKEDLSEMERRKRVQEILKSHSFCKELEGVIRQDFDSSRSDPDHLQTWQRLSELTVSQGNMSLGNLYSSGSTIPIADLRGNEKYTKLERMQRNKLASLFRLADFSQWSQGIYNDITFQMAEENPEYLVNPFGLLYHEITAGALVKVDETGNVLDPGTTKLGINSTAFRLHAAIHKARPDAKCVLHMHTAVVAAVASMKCGLLPICHEAMVIGPVAYHEYLEIGDDDSAVEEVVRSLGDKNVMLLRNHGFLVIGDTVEHATYLAHNTVVACETQVRAARAGIENLVILDQNAIARAHRDAKNANSGSLKRLSSSGMQWKVGELEWEAWMRVMDHAGMRTGHIYRQPMLRPKSALAQSNTNRSDVATPPAASSVGAVDESDPESLAAHKLALLRKDQVRWTNSPNAYQKIEFLESGTDRPKKITKWVQDANSPSASGTPTKINGAHQFSPASHNPKEFKEKQKEIKEIRRLGATTAGPQSQILDGVNYDDIAITVRVPDSEGLVGQSSPQDRAIFIGTASKGIIDRQFQHNAQVYKQLYAPNPFSVETDENIKKYIQEVESKSPKAKTPTDRTARSARTENSFDADADLADTASLMQGIREHQMSAKSGSADPIADSSFASTKSNAPSSTGVPRSPEVQEPSSKEVVRRRFTVERVSIDNDPFDQNGNSASHSALNTVDETTSAEKQKKKKKGFFSFIRKKDKSS
ncbi:unnamed protein product [Caenorhabditis auriculariae]|uniref:Class II aldolase/adducin N-terminal domain-containing protein n=1 Tax=Caenorhabditis auriculariae TaxID=2777116 RepID=A0A8S1GPD2_9PELO|nr:unnamed protein product [Caenorhabditis auriculariae]